MLYGYAGKILHVDLTAGYDATEEPSEEFYRAYWGGSLMGDVFPAPARARRRGSSGSGEYAVVHAVARRRRTRQRTEPASPRPRRARYPA